MPPSISRCFFRQDSTRGQKIEAGHGAAQPVVSLIQLRRYTFGFFAGQQPAGLLAAPRTVRLRHPTVTMDEMDPSREHDPLRQPAEAFATTHWSLVLRAGQSGSPEADAALAALCQRYWLPLYA